MMKVLLLFALVLFVEGRGVDEDIAAAPESSDAFQLLQKNGTAIRFELDLMVPVDEYVYLKKYGKAGQETRPVERRDLDLVLRYRRKGIGDKKKRWPDKTVPYEIQGCFSDREKDNIYAAMADYHKYTCTRWRVAKKSESVKTYFADHNSGCYAYPGCYFQSQPINLGRGCRGKGTIVHEMGHTLGLYHEQSRPDRDEYIMIHKENLIDGTEGQFFKYSTSVIPDWGVEYDYSSVMHYGEKAFSRNRRKTITALKSGFQGEMGNRVGLAFSDIKMINLMYQCDEQCKRKPRCPSDGFVGKDCKCWCKGDSLENPVKYCNGRGQPTDPGPKVEKDLDAPSGCKSGTTGKVKPKRPGGNSCKDKTGDCRKNLKYCKDRGWHKYMRDNCNKSCGFCRRTSSFSRGCSDGMDRCEQFADKGECVTNVVFMRSACRASCGSCENQNGPQIEAIEECEDIKESCINAAKAGQCDIDPIVMHTECRKSCGIC